MMLAPGTRVRLRAPSRLLTLRTETGTVVRMDEQRGYVVVWLDEPAEYQHVGPAVQLQEIREAVDNLEVLGEAGC